MDLHWLVRGSRALALLLMIGVLVAGCATPDEARGPDDNNLDKDRDGVPDQGGYAPEVNQTNETLTQPDLPTGLDGG